MDLIEFIGFVISLGAMIFLFFKRRIEDRNREDEQDEELNPDELEQEKALKEFLRSLDIEMDEENEKPHYPQESARKEVIHAPPPKPPVRVQAQIKIKKVEMPPIHEGFSQSNQEAFAQKSHIENRWTQTSLEKGEINKTTIGGTQDHAYAFKGKKGLGRGRDILEKLQTKNDMIVIAEILGKPKGLL